MIERLVLKSIIFAFSVSLFQCVDGYPYMNRCPSGLYFDDIAKYCTFKNEARCGPLASSEYILYYSLIILTF